MNDAYDLSKQRRRSDHGQLQFSKGYQAGHAAARAEAEALLREAQDAIDWCADECEHKEAKKLAQRIEAWLKGEKQ